MKMIEYEKVITEMERYKTIMKENWERNISKDGAAANYYRGRYNSAIDMINILKGGLEE